MSQEKTSSIRPSLFSFLAGAAVGAVVVALSTPKTGPKLRGDLKDLAHRAKIKVCGLSDEVYETLDEMKERTALATDDLKRGISDASLDLQGHLPS